MRYVDYYGNYSYADEWVQAAFDERKTNFDNGNGNFQLWRRPFSHIKPEDFHGLVVTS